MASTSTIECSIPQLHKRNDSIYSFHDEDPLDHEMEIIFFHDIQWSLQECKQPHIETWMSANTSDRPSVCWPKDWLKQIFPKAKTLSTLYDGAMWQTDTAARGTFYTVAENLVSDILLEYKENSPIVLVGHGFGGIVIKKVIKIMSDCSLFLKPDSKKSNSFLNNVKGVYYFAPPFLGVIAPDSTRKLPRIGPLLNYLEVFNPEVSQLNHWFSQWRRGKGFRAMAASAALPTKMAVPLAWRILQALDCRRRFTHITGESRVDIDEFYTCHMDHYNICKLKGMTDSSFQQLILLIDPRFPLKSIYEPRPRNVEVAEVACTEFVENISRQVVGQRTIFLPMRSIERKFLNVRFRLEKAGLKQRSLPSGAGVEMWGR